MCTRAPKIRQHCRLEMGLRTTIHCESEDNAVALILNIRKSNPRKITEIFQDYPVL